MNYLVRGIIDSFGRTLLVELEIPVTYCAAKLRHTVPEIRIDLFHHLSAFIRKAIKIYICSHLPICCALDHVRRRMKCDVESKLPLLPYFWII